jgi:hypothetical protein
LSTSKDPGPEGPAFNVRIKIKITCRYKPRPVLKPIPAFFLADLINLVQNGAVGNNGKTNNSRMIYLPKPFRSSGSKGSGFTPFLNGEL